MTRMRSLLTAPASRPDLMAKAPRARPDAVFLDLEDGVPPGAKEAARANARVAATELAGAHPDLGVFVRVNGLSTPWFAGDLAEALLPELTGVVVPKLESRADVDAVAEALAEAGCPGLPVLAGIESARGVAYVDEVLVAPVQWCYFGAEDFVADMGGVRTAENVEVLYARSRVALAARVAGVHALDQIVADFRDDERYLTDAAQARALGYQGKLCIHPAQVALAHEAFTPSAEEVDRAARLLAAYEEAARAVRRRWPSRARWSTSRWRVAPGPCWMRRRGRRGPSRTEASAPRREREHVVIPAEVVAALHRVVIADVGLPDGNGLRLLKRIRRNSPALQGIALSGYGMPQDIADARTAGFSTYLAKPVQFPELRKALESLIPQAKAASLRQMRE